MELSEIPGTGTQLDECISEIETSHHLGKDFQTRGYGVPSAYNMCIEHVCILIDLL
jgi:hypothetical protein